MSVEISQLPLNLSLLILNAENTRTLNQVKVLDIFQGGSSAFHPDGLFSVEIFGKVGDERRNRLFGYIDLKIEIFHPVIYKALLDLKELYGEIMSGKRYAVFDKVLKDFVPSNADGKQTGFAFFMSHFHELKFEERNSTSRDFLIRMVNNERANAVMNKLLVMPAGLRDYTITENGKPEEDEINGFYRKVISISNVIGTQNAGKDISHLDASRYRLQTEIYALYSYITDLLKGKGKLIQGWWTSRNVFNSTRNVITSLVPQSVELGDATSISINHTVVGLYQTMVSLFPLASNLVRNTLADIFPGPNTPALLINKKDYSLSRHSVDPVSYDLWMTQEGLESVFARFESEPLRHEPIEVEGHYLALIYNDGKRCRIVHDISTCPEWVKKEHLKPITYAELFYLSIYEQAGETPCTVTRYPITGLGSIYPCYIYLKTTTRSHVLKVLNDAWEETSQVANEFPIAGEAFVNSMSVAGSHLVRLGADKRPLPNYQWSRVHSR